jgi:mono/diheme cytochrome c family protein
MESELEKFIASDIEPDADVDPVKDAELNDIIVNDLLATIVNDWKAAEEQVVVPAADAMPSPDRKPEQIQASVDAGRTLFYGKAACTKCHGPTGLGDGQESNYDDWSLVTVDFVKNTNDLAKSIKDGNVSEADIAARRQELKLRKKLLPHLLPPRKAIPRNLRDGIYRGGRRDIDLFWRVAGGIPGMGMPNSGPGDAGGQGTLTEQEIWQIVDYIQSLPFEPNSEPLTRPVNVRTVN